MHYDWLVVGAGFTGATLAERFASQLGQRVLVIDKRPHVGGNAYDEIDPAGVRVHRYGAHIFHTVSDRVWEHLSRFTEWLPYEHMVLASIDGKLVPLPFNLNTLHSLLPAADAVALEDRLVTAFGHDARVPVLSLMQHEDAGLRELGQYVHDTVFLNYTTKQWGLRPDELDRTVTGRVPILVGRDDRYFRDAHQGIPTNGYTAIFEKMLDHRCIDVEVGMALSDLGSSTTWDRMIYTGPIDELFDHRHGVLPYRSLRFEHQTIDVDRYQPVSVVNYPNDGDHTRILEHAHFSLQHLGRTTITHEYPQAYLPGVNEPYYPVPQTANRTRYEQYLKDAAELDGRIVLAGRLADYKYYDMDQAVAHALQLFKRIATGVEEKAA